MKLRLRFMKQYTWRLLSDAWAWLVKLGFLRHIICRLSLSMGSFKLLLSGLTKRESDWLSHKIVLLMSLLKDQARKYWVQGTLSLKFLYRDILVPRHLYLTPSLLLWRGCFVYNRIAIEVLVVKTSIFNRFVAFDAILIVVIDRVRTHLKLSGCKHRVTYCHS